MDHAAHALRPRRLQHVECPQNVAFDDLTRMAIGVRNRNQRAQMEDHLALARRLPHGIQVPQVPGHDFDGWKEVRRDEPQQTEIAA